MLPGLKDDDRPFPVGYREFPHHALPARDGTPHGQVQRSARAPNCSYFTNWTSTQDAITLGCRSRHRRRVRSAGLLHLPGQRTSAPRSNCSVGQTLPGQITEAHDPPLVGKEQDRSSRGSESFVKDFRPLDMGRIRLPAGRDLLTLRATQIPGDSVMDVRYVVLTLLP